ncbi:Hsp20/alpha crystallin family protein [Streptomyces sp. NBC_01210]|uniref:Hsp20/alpha crystallin family protein n=1 Tax=Streptomyces sp. NBC_01210 TaxID=2903774 RepID=UPI003FA37FDC
MPRAGALTASAWTSGRRSGPRSARRGGAGPPDPPQTVPDGAGRPWSTNGERGAGSDGRPTRGRCDECNDRTAAWPPLLPDPFGWVEGGVPGLHQIPGRHSIRIEESLSGGTYVSRAELPGIAPDSDIEISVAEGVLTLRAATRRPRKHHTESATALSPARSGCPPERAATMRLADLEDGVLTIPVPVPKSGTRTIPVRHG